MKIEIDERLKNLGLKATKARDWRFFVKEAQKLNKMNGVYCKNILDKGLFLYYDISVYQTDDGIDNFISLDIKINLCQATYEFDVNSGLIYHFDNDTPISYFNIGIESEEYCYDDNGDWNQDGEDSLKEIALTKIIEVEELIYNKIKDAQ